MSFAELAANSVIKPLAWTAFPAAIFVGAVRNGLVPLEFDEPRHLVRGRVLIDGESIPGVEIKLHALPIEGLTPAPQGLTTEDGAFSLRTNARQDGVAAGDYRVTVVWRHRAAHDEQFLPSDNLLPVAFARAATTPLRVTVRPGENSLELGDIPRCRCQG